MKKLAALALALCVIFPFSGFAKAGNINPHVKNAGATEDEVKAESGSADGGADIAGECDHTLNDQSAEGVQAVTQIVQNAADEISAGPGIGVRNSIQAQKTVNFADRTKSAPSAASKISTAKKSSLSSPSQAISVKSASSPNAAGTAPNAPAAGEGPAQEASQSSVETFDTRNTGSGLLRVKYADDSGKRIKLSVSKGGATYIYNLKARGSAESFSLQMGSGSYTAKILQNTSGSNYRTIETAAIDANISDPLEVYLNSIQNVNWNSSMSAIIKAGSLTRGETRDADKVKTIHDYVVSDVRYDGNKFSHVTADYIPSIDSTLRSGSGICYDYASLFGAMLRSVGVPAKLVKGYSSNAQGYHAWNEVYEGGRWVIIDTTYDAQMKDAGYSVSMIKSGSQYNKSKEY